MEKIKIAWCKLCERWMVICSICGNNTCNASTGRYAKGIPCDCEEAYNFDHELYNKYGAKIFKKRFGKKIKKLYNIKIDKRKSFTIKQIIKRGNRRIRSSN